MFCLCISDYEPQSICEHLQYLFALLQNSNRKYIDPSGLVKALGLDTGQQQVRPCRIYCDREVLSQQTFLIAFKNSPMHTTPICECMKNTQSHHYLFHKPLNSTVSFLGRPGVLKALLVPAGGHVVQTEESQPAECHPAAVLWTVLLRNCVRKLKSHQVRVGRDCGCTFVVFISLLFIIVNGIKG